jgi:hypothetical protein
MLASLVIFRNGILSSGDAVAGNDDWTTCCHRRMSAGRVKNQWITTTSLLFPDLVPAMNPYQGLVLFLTALAVNIIGGLIPVVGWFLLIPLLNVVVLVLAIIGIINAAQRKTVPLPLIGKFQLIK